MLHHHMAAESPQAEAGPDHRPVHAFPDQQRQTIFITPRLLRGGLQAVGSRVQGPGHTC